MNESVGFKRLGVMLDCSRNAVMRVDAVERMILLLEKMGYNSLMLYTEDTYEVDNQPYFGHLRGRYSKEELRRLDRFAAAHGIELIPCIQTLAHLNALMSWSVYRSIRDNNDILLAGDDRVYKLIEDIFSTLEQCFTSRIVNVGMDEAFTLGLGRYLELHGLRERSEILLEHLGRVAETAARHGFEVCMWGDMFKNLLGKETAETVRERIPKNVRLIHWDYDTTDEKKYDKSFADYQRICGDLWFAGGARTWTGFAPHNGFALKTAKSAVPSCIRNGIENVFITLWGDNGGECSRFSVLPALYAVSQHARGNYDENSIRSGFSEMFGVGFDDFMQIDLPASPNGEGNTVDSEKYLLYNDCFLGRLDSTVAPGDGLRFAESAQRLEKLSNSPDFGKIFTALKELCNVLEIKAEIGWHTREAYRSGRKAALSEVVTEYDELLKRLETFYSAYEKWWMWENKPHGFDVQDIRLGGLIRRVKHCRSRIEEYIEGNTKCIEELEEPVLSITCSGEELPRRPLCLNNWGQSATCNVIDY